MYYLTSFTIGKVCWSVTALFGILLGGKLTLKSHWLDVPSFTDLGKIRLTSPDGFNVVVGVHWAVIISFCRSNVQHPFSWQGTSVSWGFGASLSQKFWKYAKHCSYITKLYWPMTCKIKLLWPSSNIQCLVRDKHQCLMRPRLRIHLPWPACGLKKFKYS